MTNKKLGLLLLPLIPLSALGIVEIADELTPPTTIVRECQPEPVARVAPPPTTIVEAPKPVLSL